MLTKNIAKLRAEVAKHVAADSIIQGTYWNAESHQGCFIGCLAHGNDPAINEQEYGLPLMVQRIGESIFESLPKDEAKNFFAALPDAVGWDGKDLSRVGWQFLEAELRSLPQQKREIQDVINPVILGVARLAQGLKWSREDAVAAREAAGAWEAAAEAAAAAARAAAWAAAEEAAAGWAWAAWAAWAAAEAAAWAARAEARLLLLSSARLRQRDLLLRLLREAPTSA